MSFLQLSNGFLNELVDLSCAIGKKLFCENAKNIIICRQKFHRVYVRETCFKRFLEFHETVSSNRTLLYFLKLVSYFSRQLANHSSAISEGQFSCNFYKCAYAIKKGVF